MLDQKLVNGIPSKRVAISCAKLFDIVLIVFNILDIVTTSEHALSLMFSNQYSLMIFESILSHDDDMADMNSQAACEKDFENRINSRLKG